MQRVIVFSEISKEQWPLEALDEWGEVVFLYEKNERPPTIANFDVFTQAIALKLKRIEFDYQNDAFVLVGRQVDICMTAFVLGRLNKSITMLVYHPRDERYTKKEITASGLSNA